MEEEINDVVLAFTKSFKALQIYGITHPSFKNFYVPFYQKVKDFLNKYNELIFQIERFTILHSDRLVYEEKEMDMSIAFRLFKNGIRNVGFIEGLTSDELLLFLDIIAQPDKDYDIALGLWECDFTHINFYVVEEEEVLDYKMPDTPIMEINYDEKVKELIAREKIDIDAIIIPDLDTNEIKNLMANITHEEKSALLPLVVNTLTEFLNTERSQEIIEGLIELLEVCVDNRDFYNARKIIYKLGDYPDVNFMERFENEATIMGFQDFLDVPRNEIFNEFMAFIGFFSKKAIPYLLKMMSMTNRQDRIHALRHRIAYIAQDDSSPIVPFLNNEDIDVVINTISILGIMKPKDLVNSLQPLIYHSDQRVRGEVVSALGNMKEPAPIAKSLDDPDLDVRIKALRALNQMKYSKIYSELLRRINDKNFLNLEYAEQKEYFNCLIANGDSGLTDNLKGLLFKRKFFGKKKYRVMRRLAASALVQLNKQEALEIVKTGSKKNNKDIKLACEMALKGK